MTVALGGAPLGVGQARRGLFARVARALLGQLDRRPQIAERRLQRLDLLAMSLGHRASALAGVETLLGQLSARMYAARQPASAVQAQAERQGEEQGEAATQGGQQGGRHGIALRYLDERTTMMLWTYSRLISKNDLP